MNSRIISRRRVEHYHKWIQSLLTSLELKQYDNDLAKNIEEFKKLNDILLEAQKVSIPEQYLEVVLGLKLSGIVKLIREIRDVMRFHNSAEIQEQGSAVLYIFSRIISDNPDYYNNPDYVEMVKQLREGMIRTSLDMLRKHIDKESVVRIGFDILNHYWSIDSMVSLST